MEHIRSTLATTAAAVLGLVVAAHVLHPGNFEEPPRPARRADAVATASEASLAPVRTVAWTDPPADLRGGTTPVSATVADVSPPPRAAVAPPQDETVTPPRSRETAAPVSRARKAAQTVRSKARRTVRTRRAGPTRVAAVTTPPPTIRSAERPAGAAVDPIGGLLRGLDLGS